MKRACIARALRAWGRAASTSSDPPADVPRPRSPPRPRRHPARAPAPAPAPAPPATPPGPPASLEECLGADVRAAVDAILEKPGSAGVGQEVAKLDAIGWGNHADVPECTGTRPVVCASQFAAFCIAVRNAGLQRSLPAVWHAMPEDIRCTDWAVLRVLTQQQRVEMTVVFDELWPGISEEAAKVVFTPRVVSLVVAGMTTPTTNSPPWRLVHFERVQRQMSLHLRTADAKSVGRMTWDYYERVVLYLGAADEVVSLRNLLRRLFESEERTPDRWLTHLRPTKVYPTAVISAVLTACRQTGQGVLIIRFVATMCPDQLSKQAGLIAQFLDPEEVAEDAEDEEEEVVVGEGRSPQAGGGGVAQQDDLLSLHADLLPFFALTILAHERRMPKELQARMFAKRVRTWPLEVVPPPRVLSNPDIAGAFVYRLLSGGKLHAAMRLLGTMPARVPPKAYTAVLLALSELPAQRAAFLYEEVAMERQSGPARRPASPGVCRAMLALRVHLHDQLRDLQDSDVHLGDEEFAANRLFGDVLTLAYGDPKTDASTSQHRLKATNFMKAAAVLSLVYRQVLSDSRAQQSAYSFVDETARPFAYLHAIGITSPKADVMIVQALPHFAAVPVLTEITRVYFDALQASESMSRLRSAAARHGHALVQVRRNVRVSLRFGAGTTHLVLVDAPFARWLVQRYPEGIPQVRRGFHLLLPCSTLMELSGSSGGDVSGSAWLRTGNLRGQETMQALAELLVSQPERCTALTPVSEMALIGSQLFPPDTQSNLSWASDSSGPTATLPEAASSIAGYLAETHPEPRFYAGLDEKVDSPPCALVDAETLEVRPGQVVTGHVKETLHATLLPLTTSGVTLLSAGDHFESEQLVELRRHVKLNLAANATCLSPEGLADKVFRPTHVLSDSDDQEEFEDELIGGDELGESFLQAPTVRGL